MRTFCTLVSLDVANGGGCVVAEFRGQTTYPLVIMAYSLARVRVTFVAFV